MSSIEIGTYQTVNRRTCIVVGHNKTSVELVKLDTSLGLRVSEMTEASFKKEYKLITGYPLHKSIEQYIEFGTYCGISEQVKSLFEDMLKGISKKEKIDTSLALDKLKAAKLLTETTNGRAARPAKRQADDSPPCEEDTPSKSEAKEKVKKTVSGKLHDGVSKKGSEDTKIQQPTKEDKKTMPRKSTKVPAATTQKNTGSIKVGRPSAAQMFRELILSNSYDDDTIFRMVQKEYGLDDSKRNYVSYYRRELKQKGLI